MRRPSSWSFMTLIFLILSSLVTEVLAATPTSFCKCINNKSKKSMIIPLDQQSSSSSTSIKTLRRSTLAADDTPVPPKAPSEAIPYKPKTCSDCNKQFCLDLSLPDFKDADEEDVQTSCFQRDSFKDEAVVFIFIIATVSLLAWALGKPLVEKYWNKAKERRMYIPVANESER